MADDPFIPSPFPSRLGVRDIGYQVFDPTPASTEQQAITYFVQVAWDNDTITQESGNLIPHLTIPEINVLKALFLRLRNKATVAYGGSAP